MASSDRFSITVQGRGDVPLVPGVSVDHHVHVRLDVGEHPANDVALPPQGLHADDGACLTRSRRGRIGRCVVVHVDVGARERRTKPANDLSDGLFFVETRNQHSNAHAQVAPERVDATGGKCMQVMATAPNSQVFRPCFGP